MIRREYPAGAGIYIEGQNRHIPLSQASGSKLLDLDMANLKFCIGEMSFDKEVVVADIQDNVLIGLDIEDPFDVITREKNVVIRGQMYL
jgi:hypothetical protein